jgi:hypothetical protein
MDLSEILKSSQKVDCDDKHQKDDIGKILSRQLEKYDTLLAVRPIRWHRHLIFKPPNSAARTSAVPSLKVPDRSSPLFM